jgi:hypothetical protein
MKLKFRKIASILTSGVLLSSTLGFAAAASYPAPFVVGGTPDVAIVVGSASQASDWSVAAQLSADLGGRVSTSSQTEASVSGGSAKSLASGSDLVYLADDLAENVATISDTDLTTVLASATFEDDGGTEYDYDQTIKVNPTAQTSSAGSGLYFGTSGSDLDDSTVYVKLSTDTTKPIYTLRVDFDDPVNFTDSESEGQTIKLFGKEFTVGTATDSDTLVLLGGSSETVLEVGTPVSVDLDGTKHEVSLTGISSSDDSPAALLVVDGISKKVLEGNSVKIAGLDIYVKEVFKTGANSGQVTVQLGSNRLTLENGDAVKVGSDADDIDGTAVSIKGGVGACTRLEFNITAEDSDVDHVLEGESFVDPVFGTISLDFKALHNGPDLEAATDASTTRKKLDIISSGDTELNVKVEVPGEDVATIPFVYQGAFKDEDSNPIAVWEGAPLTDDDYFFLNSGSNQHLMQITKLSLANDGSDITIKDVIEGQSGAVSMSNEDDLNTTAGTSTTFNYKGQTYTITVVNATAVKITSDDYGLTSGKKIAVYPYIELVDGEDVRFAYTDDVTISGLANGAILELPTGTITVATNTTVTRDTGAVYYNITQTAASSTTSNIVIGITNNGADLGTAGARRTSPALLFVEEEDKTETTSGTKNAILLNPVYSTYEELNATPIFSGTKLSGSFDDEDYSSYLTAFGSYVLIDSSDNDQTVGSITYTGTQMYAEVFVSEVGAVITPGSSGSGGQVSTVKDSEVSSVSGKNLIVVGGSCVNTVAAKMLASDSPLCGAAFTAKTNVGATQYILKTMKSPYNDNKIAMLVAGYEAQDTANAVAKLKEGASTDVGEKVYPVATA